ncbi:P-II family nitrogen regulator [Leptospirillum ferrooxidans]|uniref:Putative nitrogen regulatory protein P-II glnB-like protein 1 n=1 Tax=Leptospirillum ferrooxidans (strain C2-3) TaxID=1162668 RepID=I0ILP8_LEPFC|nr:P-II family nitrogen regulator [Leptospirillum ferrooxidans]BAM06197.1 putative nitrogen regulatory protein P-II glnB-like protein 1 [Leptospirillum ferrooxidans C2-3]
MKLIRAIVRSEKEPQVLKSLESGGFYAMTKFPVVGRGQQQGIQVGDVSYDTLSKLEFLVVVSDTDLAAVVQCIEEAAYTGHPGDGKIFIQEVLSSHTIRTGAEEHGE